VKDTVIHAISIFYDVSVVSVFDTSRFVKDNRLKTL
jgi:hypothetical protein